MDASLLAIFIIFVVILLTAALAIAQNNRHSEDQFNRRVKKSWGRLVPKSYRPEEFEAIRAYSDAHMSSFIDDLTWSDCDMDAIYKKMDQTLSSPGQDVLYAWLRHPLTDGHVLKERDTLITGLGEHASLREKLQKILFRLGRFPRTSYYRAICSISCSENAGKGTNKKGSALDPSPASHPSGMPEDVHRVQPAGTGTAAGRTQLAETVAATGRSQPKGTTSAADHGQSVGTGTAAGRGLYIGAAVLSAVLIGLLFVQPVVSVILIVPDFIFNMLLYFRSRAAVKTPVQGFRAIDRILRASDAVLKMKSEGLSVEEDLESDLRAFAPFRKWSVFVTAGSSEGSGTGEVLLMYLNIFFHFDMIFYRPVMEAATGHRRELMEMYEVLGRLDAAISAASYREAMPVWCRGEFFEVPGGAAEGEGAESAGGVASARTATTSAGAASAQVTLIFEGLVHPLLDKPVANSMTTRGGNLITGANASGKSTFLKSVAIGAILAQSIGTVPARKWSAPYFRIFTSMAIRDNLFQGESYFVVEIRSLARISNAMNEEGAPVLALIDEVLRGTNTVERIAASSQILAEFAGQARLKKNSSCCREGSHGEDGKRDARQGFDEERCLHGAGGASGRWKGTHRDAGHSVIFAATHDAELTDILRGCYQNWHFEGRVEDGDVHFNYKILAGPTRERNAIALLRLAGFSDELAEAAEVEARGFEETGEWKLNRYSPD
ncbi:MAG: hypothetical protein VZR02_08255 [Lachnospiraceae bacterium]|nr:hypothetical protein [Lachnospiraceae bacterium]